MYDSSKSSRELSGAANRGTDARWRKRRRQPMASLLFFIMNLDGPKKTQHQVNLSKYSRSRCCRRREPWPAHASPAAASCWRTAWLLRLSANREDIDIKWAVYRLSLCPISIPFLQMLHFALEMCLAVNRVNFIDRAGKSKDENARLLLRYLLVMILILKY